MYIYKNLDKYFEKCDNCGECCKIPGVLLPEQLTLIAEHLEISTQELFEKHLITELCSPDDYITPVFALSPVKVNANGERHPFHLMDSEYINIKNLHCIFFDKENSKCKIHKVKPFGCDLLICSKMTNDKEINLEKSYYFHKWQSHQNILYDFYPDLEQTANDLNNVVSSIQNSFAKRNEIINIRISTIMNGSPMAGTSIFK